jgi:hypothetical protein
MKLDIFSLIYFRNPKQRKPDITKAKQKLEWGT